MFVIESLGDDVVFRIPVEVVAKKKIPTISVLLDSTVLSCWQVVTDARG